ncbi:MAG: AbrB/MazE/SpoVT family DNA-binding domain-containing protein [Anaerolineales bacterium]|nr:AbrB/MazE/SpoVT family DNA-binding domain-containing protein [Anaerolineales bacterium]
MMLSTRIGRRGQIVLPREVRQRIKVDEGDQIAFIIDGEQVIIKPITQNLLDLRGSVPVSGEQDFDTIRKEVTAKRAKRGSRDEG